MSEQLGKHIAQQISIFETDIPKILAYFSLATFDKKRTYYKKTNLVSTYIS